MNPCVYQVPDPTTNQRNSEDRSKDPKSPVDVPHAALSLGLLDHKPQEARVHQRDRQRDGAEEAGEVREERKGGGYEERKRPEEDTEGGPEPSWARTVAFACVCHF